MSIFTRVYQVAERLGINEQEVLNLVAKGELEQTTFRGKCGINPSSVDKYIIKCLKEYREMKKSLKIEAPNSKKVNEN